MAISVGSRLGHYEVTALIGEGGMGQVWQATDTKLNRQVALKILPDAFAADLDRLARFQREAQVLASLNHPGIAAIHGIEEDDDTRALVLELVEGPTLADRIAQGPIPVDEALPITRQITEALEAAHEAGVIHRDLKPANIKVRDDGTVKVLDFGLAKALATTPQGDPRQSPTLTAAATQMGMIMGTAAYMSPEQARGKPVDKRVDIWAIGVVLYEMLTGGRPFIGDDVAQTLAEVIASEPDWGALPESVSPVLGFFLRACLNKNPAQRVHDVADVRLLLDWNAEKTSDLDQAPAVGSRRLGWLGACALALTASALTALIVLAWSELTQPSPRGVVRALLTPPPPASLADVGGSPPDGTLALTSDGSRVVYRALVDGLPYLFVRAMDELTASPLQGLDAVRQASGAPRGPFISPSGDWVGFWGVIDGAFGLKRVSVNGGPPLTISEVAGVTTGPPRGATWGAGDSIIFATEDEATGLMQVAVEGGEIEILTVPNAARGERDHLFPEFLPGEEAVLFTIAPGGPIQNSQVAVLTLATGDIDVLVAGGSHARYVSTGHIVYGANDGSLRVSPFDTDTLEISGAPVRVMDDVRTSPFGAVDFDVAPDGALVYVSRSAAPTAPRVGLVRVDRHGSEEQIAAALGRYDLVRLSPDGTRVALATAGETGTSDIYIYDLVRNDLLQLTVDAADDSYPLWTPGGEAVVFTSSRDGQQGNLYRRAADGTGAVERLTRGTFTQRPFSWSVDGRTLLVHRGSGDLYTVSFDQPTSGLLAETALLATPATETQPAISPGGRWLAYESNQEGQDEIYVRPFPNVEEGQSKVSTNGGTSPVWSHDGDELFYRDLSGAMMAVPVSLEPAFSAGVQEMLFEGPYVAAFDVARDGRFLMLKPTESQPDDGTRPELVVVFNWLDEVARLVSVP